MTDRDAPDLAQRLALARRYIAAIERQAEMVVSWTWDEHNAIIDELRAARDAWHANDPAPADPGAPEGKPYIVVGVGGFFDESDEFPLLTDPGETVYVRLDRCDQAVAVLADATPDALPPADPGGPMTLDFTERELRILATCVYVRSEAISLAMTTRGMAQGRQHREQEAKDLCAIADKIAKALRQEDPT